MLLAARWARTAGQIDDAAPEVDLLAVSRRWRSSGTIRPASSPAGRSRCSPCARAIVEPRELLIVDEPSKGLAPAIINNMIDAFAQLKASGVTILLVEQNINFAKRLGDTVAVMDNGVVVHAGSMKELAEDEALQHSLLGLAI